jgi:hypothetical protein
VIGLAGRFDHEESHSVPRGVFCRNAHDWVGHILTMEGCPGFDDGNPFRIAIVGHSLKRRLDRPAIGGKNS